MPRPLKLGILGIHSIILSKDIIHKNAERYLGFHGFMEIDKIDRNQINVTMSL